MNLAIFTIFLIAVYYFCFSPTSQFFGKINYRGKTDGKIVALTFDDGPNEPYTSQILDILRTYDIKATFFVVGENSMRCTEATKRIFSEGHVIGNHSFHHSFLTPIFFPNFRKEIANAQNSIERLTGRKPALFRPPWFFRQPLMLKTAKKYGLVAVTGTFGSHRENFRSNSQSISGSALRRTKPGTILVFHDGYNNKRAKREKTVEALKIIIPRLLDNGYKFVTVPQLLNIADYQ